MTKYAADAVTCFKQVLSRSITVEFIIPLFALFCVPCVPLSSRAFVRACDFARLIRVVTQTDRRDITSSPVRLCDESGKSRKFADRNEHTGT